MASHSSLSITDNARMAHGVLDRIRPKARWDHAAHCAAALYLLRAGAVQPIEVLAGTSGQPGWLPGRWSKETPMLVAARCGWMPPDKAPLPW